MATKSLIMYEDRDDKFITALYADVYNEALYAETHWIGEDGEVKNESVEMAVHVDDIIKIRDFCNKLISKIGPAGTYNDKGILVEAI